MNLELLRKERGMGIPKMGCYEFGIIKEIKRDGHTKNGML
jgi:hypothetical protein